MVSLKKHCLLLTWRTGLSGSKILREEEEVLLLKGYDANDTLCLFHSEHDATIFFDYINRSRHPNIGFTMEKQVNHKLPLLEVLIDNNDPNSSLTSVYRNLENFHRVIN